MKYYIGANPHVRVTIEMWWLAYTEREKNWSGFSLIHRERESNNMAQQTKIIFFEKRREKSLQWSNFSKQGRKGWTAGRLQTVSWWAFWARHMRRSSRTPPTAGTCDSASAQRRCGGSWARIASGFQVKPESARKRHHAENGGHESRRWIGWPVGREVAHLCCRWCSLASVVWRPWACPSALGIHQASGNPCQP